jgi:hypothetical protein
MWHEIMNLVELSANLEVPCNFSRRVELDTLRFVIITSHYIWIVVKNVIVLITVHFLTSLKCVQIVRAGHHYTGLWIVATLMSQSCWSAGMLM